MVYALTLITLAFWALVGFLFYWCAAPYECRTPLQLVNMALVAVLSGPIVWFAALVVALRLEDCFPTTRLPGRNKRKAEFALDPIPREGVGKA